MSIVKFVINKNLEIKGIYNAANISAYGENFLRSLDKEILSKAKGKSFDDCKEQITEYVEEYYKINKDIIDRKLKDLEIVWNIVEDKFFIRLEDITKKSFPHDTVLVFATITRFCDYNYKKVWIKAAINKNVLLLPSNIAHELLHLYYYHYDQNKVLMHLTQEESEVLKESLTFLINAEFKDILTPTDNGYKAHEAIRQGLSEFWDKHRDYDRLILEGIRIMESKRENKKTPARREV